MDKQRKPDYRVTISTFLNAEQKAKVLAEETFIVDPVQLGYERVYSGPSEAKAATAFVRAVRRARTNPLARSVTMWENDSVLLSIKLLGD